MGPYYDQFCITPHLYDIRFTCSLTGTNYDVTGRQNDNINYEDNINYDDNRNQIANNDISNNNRAINTINYSNNNSDVREGNYSTGAGYRDGVSAVANELADSQTPRVEPYVGAKSLGSQFGNFEGADFKPFDVNQEFPAIF